MSQETLKATKEECIKIADYWYKKQFEEPRWRIVNKLAATTSDCVENLLAWLRGELSKMDYGEIGLTFTVHDGGIVKWRQIKQVTGKP